MNLTNIKSITVVLFLILAAAPRAGASLILSWFAGSTFNANSTIMDATLGLTGEVEDGFETTTFIPGLTISLTGGVPATTWTSLPNLYNVNGDSEAQNNNWDGPDVATNLLSNSIGDTNRANLIVFNYAPGATSFGIGLSNFQSTNPVSPQFPVTNHELFVNGVDMGVVETLAGAKWTPGLVRNAYLRIDATGGSNITSVGFENLTASDGLLFDHLAVLTSVPEPSTCWLLISGLSLAALRLSRRR
jgi:PEP-CTERM motif